MICFDICRIKRDDDRYKVYSVGIDPAHGLGINALVMDTL